MKLDKAIINRLPIPEALTNKIYFAVNVYYSDNKEFLAELERKNGIRGYIRFYCNNYLNMEFSYTTEENKVTTMLGEHEFIAVRSFSSKSSLHIASVLSLFRLNSYFTFYLFDNNMIHYLPKLDITDSNQLPKSLTHPTICEPEKYFPTRPTLPIVIDNNNKVDIKEYQKFSAVDFNDHICSALTITNSNYSHSAPTAILNNLISKYFSQERLQKETKSVGSGFITELTFKDFKESGHNSCKRTSAHIAALKLLNKIYPEITHYIDFLYLLSPKIRKQELLDQPSSQTSTNSPSLDTKPTAINSTNTQNKQSNSTNKNPTLVQNSNSENNEDNFNKYRYLRKDNTNTLDNLQRLVKAETKTEELAEGLENLNVKSNVFDLNMLSLEEIKRIYLSTKNKEMKTITEEYLKGKLRTETNKNKTVSEIINESVSEEEYGYISEDEDGADINELMGIFRPRI
eukprot:GAHX01002513.1.p1 GENE.GAHX01002513.1~~GAHX01002513.1.p1  ORF type:complete len:458 (+),score=81.64 GAHX01002513.1:44-1417(+)